MSLKVGIYLIAIVLLLSTVGWFALHERGVEHAKDAKADNKAVATQVKSDQKADTDAIDALKLANLKLAEWIRDHPSGTHIIVRGPSSCAKGNATTSGSQTADVPAGPSAPVRDGDQSDTSVDIGPRVQLLGIVAERAAAIATACQVDAAGKSAN